VGRVAISFLLMWVAMMVGNDVALRAANVSKNTGGTGPPFAAWHLDISPSGPPPRWDLWLGVAFAAVAMWWESFSRAVP